MKNLVLILGLTVPLMACSSGEARQDSAAAATPANARAATGAASGPSATPASAEATPAPAPERSEPSSPAAAPSTEPAYREVTIPAGTALPLTLRTTVGSATSNVEDPVRATLSRPVRIGGVEALPAGTAVTGHVTNAVRSAKVKGRATVAFRFTRVDLPGEGGQLNVRTGTVSRMAPATKKRDAATIGGGAVGGAIVGGILGGGDGAAKGAAIGGAGGTGVVLATRGKEVSLAAGTPVTVKLTAPLTVRVKVR